MPVIRARNSNNSFIPRPLLVLLDDAPGKRGVPREVGEATHAHLLELLAAGEIRPVIGNEVAFEDVPGALEALERRETTGRTVVRL